MIKVAPSILAADFANLAAELKKIENYADLVHVDVMDGVFVPNITIGAPVVRAIKKQTNLPLDVHLMIENPHKHVEDFVKAGAFLITFHLEAYTDENIDRRNLSLKDQNSINQEKIFETISLIKSLGAKVGLSINPPTEIELIRPYLKFIDLVLVMSVNPGFGGQKFIEPSYEKVNKLLRMLAEENLKPGNNFQQGELAIEVDGGIYPGEISKNLISLGANILVAGSAVYQSTNIPEAISSLKHA